MKSCVAIALTLLVGACGGTVDDRSARGNDGLGTCSGCSDPPPSDDPAPGDPPPPDPVDAAPTDPVPVPPPQPQPKPVEAIAIFERDMPAIDWSGTSGGSTGGGTGLDPNTLHLIIGTSGASCADPQAIADCGEWMLRIPLSPELQQLGTIPMAAVYASYSFGDAPRSSELYDCAMGVGSFLDGWLTIHEISDSRVVFSLSQASTFVGGLDGRYDAVRCY